jgi:outer membrane protein assembly factor BamA
MGSRAKAAPILLAIIIGASCSAVVADTVEAPRASSDESRSQPPSAADLESPGTVIGDIYIDAQNIFDLNDPKENNGLYRAANKVHIRTRDSVIRDQLLFRPGDPYSARLLAESERILRSARYLYDASVRPVAFHDGKVDVAVTTHDVWTLNPGISFGRHGGANTFGVELEELNILGTGTCLSLSQKSGIDRDSTLLEYKDPHVAGTWTSLDASYANNSDGSLRSLQLERPFYALDTRWAAGATAVDDQRVDSLYDLGKIVDEFQTHRKFASAYWGWSDGLDGGWTRRWRVGATLDERDFEVTPNAISTTVLPEDRRLVYPWISFDLIQDKFSTFTNRDQIGRTEDFFLGTRFQLSIGWSDLAFGADRNALVFKTSLGHGIESSEDSTLLLLSTFSGRVEEGELRNAVLNAAARYYVTQSPRRLFFTTLEASAGRNLDVDEQLLLGGDNGLRGYPLRYQGGTHRALLTVEERYFTDWYPFRLFRIGAAAFFDIGRTWGDTPVNTPSLGLLKDVGIGLRIGNTRSGLGNMIHVDLAFPLDGDPSIEKVQLLIETKERF